MLIHILEIPELGDNIVWQIILVNLVNETYLKDQRRYLNRLLTLCIVYTWHSRAGILKEAVQIQFESKAVTFSIFVESQLKKGKLKCE